MRLSDLDRSILLCLVALLAAVVSPASAEPITFVFEGTVEDAFDGLGALGGLVVPGTPIRGAYTFDSETPNTAEPVGEGELGLYHHEDPPAGVAIRIGPFLFRTVPAEPDFDILVANDFGFVGTDEYGFTSENNESQGLFPAPPIDWLDIAWLAVNFDGLPFEDAELPLLPPDLDVLGGGELEIEGECLVCLGPAQFFRIDATLTSLDLALTLRLDRELLNWNATEAGAVFDILRGDLVTLVDSEGDFSAANLACLENDHEGNSSPHPLTPAGGQGFWYLVREVRSDGNGTYDSGGLAQLAGRDASISLSGNDCP